LGSELKRYFTVRNSIQGDKASLEEIVGLSFPMFFRFFASGSLNSEGLVLVGEADGKVVGFAKLIEFKLSGERFGCVLWLAVHPDFRRRTVATGLVETGTIHLLRHGARAVFASTQRGNVGSLATFAEACYEQVSFLDLWRIFGWRVFSLYRKIWYAPGEIVLMYKIKTTLPIHANRR
jgi:GNAT superfamily N-acetyltransferase